MDLNWAGAEYARRMVKSGKYDKNFRPRKNFDQFKGIEIPPPNEKRGVQKQNAPDNAGARMQDAEFDKQLKQEGRI